MRNQLNSRLHWQLHFVYYEIQQCLVSEYFIRSGPNVRIHFSKRIPVVLLTLTWYMRDAGLASDGVLYVYVREGIFARVAGKFNFARHGIMSRDVVDRKRKWRHRSCAPRASNAYQRHVTGK